MEMDLTLDELFALLGRKEAELALLRRQVAALQAALEKRMPGPRPESAQVPAVPTTPGSERDRDD